MGKFSRIGILLLAIAGVGVSIYLTLFHFKVLSDPTYQSICTVNETFDCDKVNSSVYAKAFGIPLGLYGVGFYAAVALVMLVHLLGHDRFQRTSELIFGFASLAVILSVGLAYISAVKIEAFCLFCISLYVINGALWGLSLNAAGGGIRSVVERLNEELLGFYRSAPVYLSGLVFSGVVFLGGSYYLEQATISQDAMLEKTKASLLTQETPAKPATSVGFTGTKPVPPSTVSSKTTASDLNAALQGDRVVIDLFGHERRRGSASAPVVLVIFSDFECPHCQRGALAVEEVFKKNSSKMSVIYKHYPLDSECNPNMQSPMHPNACEASAAAICAGRQDQFWEMHDMLFRNQQNLGKNDLLEYAHSLGLDPGQFQTCLEDRSVYLEIARDIDQGKSIGVQGTPAIFLNGRKWSAGYDPELFSAVIDHMSRSGGASAQHDSK